MKYAEMVQSLAPLETFDRNVFVGDEQFPQEVCNLVLSLSVVYNDLRDTTLIDLLLSEIQPAKSGITRESGQYAAFRINLLRIRAGFIYELLKLVERSKKALSHSSFKKLVGKLDNSKRASWETIEEIALGGKPSGSLAQNLLFLRNKVAFHYDAGEIFRGYQRKFCAASAVQEPMISRSGNMKGSRFYFADAALEEYMLGKLQSDSFEDYVKNENELARKINQALYGIVTRFPNLRGYGWRDPLK